MRDSAWYDYVSKYFVPKIDRRGPHQCWPWTGGRNQDGYGLWTDHRYTPRRTWSAHRLVWELFNDAPISDDLQVCHTCDNPPCVNPAHLWIGSATDNAGDKVFKGRWRGGDHRGERNGHARLVEEQVIEIRRRVAAGETQAALALEFGVHVMTISQLVRRLTWRHVA